MIFSEKILNSGRETLVSEVVDALKNENDDTFLVEMGVNSRLRGAIEHYKLGNQLECIRHILLAIGSVCSALGWSEAEEYIAEQNRFLYEKRRQEEARQSA